MNFFVKIALFDIDGTILSHANSELIFIKHLAKMRIIPIKNYWLTLFNLIKQMNDIETALHENKYYLTGIDKKFIELEAQTFFHHHLCRYISNDARHEILNIKKENTKVVLLSAAPIFLTELISQELKADYHIGTNFDSCDGIYTGKIIYPQPYGLQKKIIANEFLKKNGYSFNDCIVYANALSDFALLESAHAPIAVNPSPILKKVAKNNLWQIKYWS